METKTKNANELITQLKEFSIEPDEGYIYGNDLGSYGPYKQSQRKEIYQGKVIHVVCDDVSLDDGSIAKREVAYHNGGVCIGLKHNDKYFMVKQYIIDTIKADSISETETIDIKNRLNVLNDMKKSKSKCMNIEAEIICEKESHKTIIIGKGGVMLKKIGSAARYEIEDLLRLRNLGYSFGAIAKAMHVKKELLKKYLHTLNQKDSSSS